MNIGFYKPGQPVHFGHNDDETAGWSVEITELIDILETHPDVTCGVLSQTTSEAYDWKYTFSADGNNKLPCDVVLVYSGEFSVSDCKFVQHFMNHADSVYFVETDLNLKPPEKLYQRFDRVYTQRHARSLNDGVDSLHLPMQALIARHVHRVGISPQGRNGGVFFGSEKDRTEKFFEYAIRPNVTTYIKSPTLDTNSKISHKKLLEKLHTFEWSPVFTSPEYERTNMLTQRFFECAAAGVIPFVDEDYDKEEVLIPHASPLRVSSYKDIQQTKQWLLYSHAMKLVKTYIREYGAHLTQTISYNFDEFYRASPFCVPDRVFAKPFLQSKVSNWKQALPGSDD